jgi:hypothetical protein
MAANNRRHSSSSCAFLGSGCIFFVGSSSSSDACWIALPTDAAAPLPVLPTVRGSYLLRHKLIRALHPPARGSALASAIGASTSSASSRPGFHAELAAAGVLALPDAGCSAASPRGSAHAPSPEAEYAHRGQHAGSTPQCQFWLATIAAWTGNKGPDRAVWCGPLRCNGVKGLGLRLP